MLCINCNKDIPENSKFCRFCGEKVIKENEKKQIPTKEDIAKNSKPNSNEEIPIYKAGSLINRVIAFIFDLIIVLLISFLILILFAMTGKIEDFITNSVFYVFLGTYIIYNSFSIWITGKTIGKKIFRLRVVNKSYKDPRFIQAIFRESIGKFISAIIFGLGFFLVLVDKKSQALHDILTDTNVLATNSKGKLIEGKQKKISKVRKLIFFFILTPFILFFPTYIFIAQPHEIKGSSMNPNFVDNEYVITDKISFRFKEPERGDVIVFKLPINQDIDYINRIIGLPGESIKIANGKVYINEQSLNEPYLEKTTESIKESFIEEGKNINIPKDYYFVMGDNRPHSSDSREWGFVPKSNIIGKVIFCYWPLNRWNCNKK